MLHEIGREINNAFPFHDFLFQHFRFHPFPNRRLPAERVYLAGLL